MTGRKRSEAALIGLIVANIPGIKLPFEYTVLLAPLVIVWYIIGGLRSLAEHTMTFCVPVPEWLASALEAGKKAVDRAGDKLTGGDDFYQPNAFLQPQWFQDFLYFSFGRNATAIAVFKFPHYLRGPGFPSPDAIC